MWGKKLHLGHAEGGRQKAEGFLEGSVGLTQLPRAESLRVYLQKIIKQKCMGEACLALHRFGKAFFAFCFLPSALVFLAFGPRLLALGNYAFAPPGMICAGSIPREAMALLQRSSRGVSKIRLSSMWTHSHVPS